MSHRRTAETPTPVPAHETITATTDVGPLLLHADDKVMTPIIASRGGWEPEESAFLRRVLGPGMTFLDVGANVGYFSLMAAQIVGADGLVVAVEPEPRNLALLRANLWRGGADRTRVLPIAAHDRRDLLELRFNADNRGDHRVGAATDAGGLLVPAARLDDVLGDLHVDVAKIDTQGSEGEVVAGMAGLLARNPAMVVLCEFWPEGLAERDEDPRSVLDGYARAGLRFGLLRDDGTTAPADADGVLAAIPEASGFVNLTLTR